MNIELTKPISRRRSKRKGLDHAWPRKRSMNIEQMIENMRKDESYLLQTAAEFLLMFSDIPFKMGDENGAVLLGWIGAQLSSRAYAKKKRRKR